MYVPVVMLPAPALLYEVTILGGGGGSVLLTAVSQLFWGLLRYYSLE